MQSQRKIFIFQIRCTSHLPRAIRDGKFHFITIIKYLFSWNYFIQIEIGPTGLPPECRHYLLPFLFHLLVIGQLLNLATSTGGEMFARWFHGMGRFSNYCQRPRFGITALFAVYQCSHLLAGYRLFNKDHQIAGPCYTPSAIGQRIYSQFQFVTFTNGRFFLLSHGASLQTYLSKYRRTNFTSAITFCRSH